MRQSSVGKGLGDHRLIEANPVLSYAKAAMDDDIMAE